MSDTPEQRTDWKVRAILDRDAIAADIAHLVAIMKMQRVYCIISASSSEEARIEAEMHMFKIMRISPNYVKALHARRLPT